MLHRTGRIAAAQQQPAELAARHGVVPERIATGNHGGLLVIEAVLRVRHQVANHLFGLTVGAAVKKRIPEREALTVVAGLLGHDVTPHRLGRGVGLVAQMCRRGQGRGQPYHDHEPDERGEPGVAQTRLDEAIAGQNDRGQHGGQRQVHAVLEGRVGGRQQTGGGTQYEEEASPQKTPAGAAQQAPQRQQAQAHDQQRRGPDGTPPRRHRPDIVEALTGRPYT